LTSASFGLVWALFNPFPVAKIMSQLTAGSCARISAAEPEDEDLFTTHHTLQFLSIKKVNPPNSASNAPDRFRIIMSDGIHFVQAMLATQLNSLVQEQQITKNSIAVIEKLTCNYVQEKRWARRVFFLWSGSLTFSLSDL
jgi:replication factor A1